MAILGAVLSGLRILQEKTVLFVPGVGLTLESSIRFGAGQELEFQRV